MLKLEVVPTAEAVPVAETVTAAPCNRNCTSVTAMAMLPRGPAENDRFNGREGAALLSESAFSVIGGRITISTRFVGSSALASGAGGQGPDRKSGPFTAGSSVPSMVSPNDCRL